MIKNRDFLILFFGRLITNFGDSIYLIATMLLVYSLSSSSFYTGLAMFLTSSTAIIQIILSPMIAKINIKKFLVLSQVMQGVLLLIIPYLQIIGVLRVWHILIIMPVISLLNQLVYPSQLALLPKIVDNKDLIKANSLFSLAYQGSDAIFNFLGGIVISILGFISAYYIDSVTFFINAILFIFLSNISVKSSEKKEKSKITMKGYFYDLKEGLIFWKESWLKSLLVGIIFINLAATTIYAALPEFSEGGLYYGVLLSASGIGILVGSFSANLEKLKNLKLGWIYISFILVVSLSWTSMVFIQRNTVFGKVLIFVLFFIGWTLIGLLNIYSQTVIQMIVPTYKLPIVLSSMIGVSTIVAPLGALFTSVMSKYYNIDIIILIATIIIFIIGIYWLFSNNVRNIKSLDDMGGT